jgi:AMMECR1 domain-containing protein
VAALRPGIDGVILTTTYGSSTYLPQVWEQIPDPELFLTELCRKHGAPGDCWRTDDLVRVEVYQVHHFEEAKPTA